MTDKKDGKQTKKLIGAILEGIENVKGENIVILDFDEIETSIADYFVICSANSNTQVNAIANSVEKTVRNEVKDRPIHVEGKENNTWVLLDYGNVVVHIFQTEYREYYDIESLWNDAKVVNA